LFDNGVIIIQVIIGEKVCYWKDTGMWYLMFFLHFV